MLHCHEDINTQRTGTALLGAAQTGAWILFDNLNCLRADALSAFAVQTGALLKVSPKPAPLAMLICVSAVLISIHTCTTASLKSEAA